MVKFLKGMSHIEVMTMRVRTLVLLTFILLFALSVDVHAKCSSGNISITDICWECIFPLNFAGYTTVPGVDDNTLLDFDNESICTCFHASCCADYTCTGIGITISYWAPNRAAETVSDPFCFPFWGLDLTSIGSGFSGGTNQPNARKNTATGHSFAQSHWWQNPLWEELITELIGDSLCDEGGEDSDSDIDIGYFTELDPLWNDDTLAAIIEPEALLFANPFAQLACTADALSSLAGQDMTLLFWCIGGSSAYPMAGSIAQNDYVQANERIASRFIYKMSRELLVCDTAIDACQCKRWPFWWKSHYRIQEAKPVQDYTCHALGKSSVIWGSAKNPPYKGDNFAWILFRKSTCCGFMQCL